MSQVLSYTPKAIKQTRWPVLILCCTTPVQNLLLPVHSLPVLHLHGQTGMCESFVCVCVCWLETEIQPFGSHLGTSISEATETGRIITWSLLCHL